MRRHRPAHIPLIEVPTGRAHDPRILLGANLPPPNAPPAQLPPTPAQVRGLTLSLPRSGLGLTITCPSGHVITAPLNTKAQRLNVVTLLEHLLSVQREMDLQLKPQSLGTPGAPIQYIIDQWLTSGQGKAKKLLEVGKHASFDPDSALVDLDLLP